MTKYKALLSDIWGSHLPLARDCPDEEVAAITPEPYVTPLTIREAWRWEQDKAFIGQMEGSNYDRWKLILTEVCKHRPSEQLTSRALAEELNLLTRSSPPLPGMYAALEAIAETFALGFWSNMSPLQLAYAEVMGIMKFANIPSQVSCDIGQLKDDPAVLLRMAGDAGYPPEDCLVFDDNRKFLEIAAGAGFPTAVSWRGEVRDQPFALDESTDFIVHVVERPADLILILTGQKI